MKTESFPFKLLRNKFMNVTGFLSFDDLNRTRTIAYCVLKVGDEHFFSKNYTRSPIVVVNILDFSSPGILLTAIHQHVKQGVRLLDYNNNTDREIAPDRKTNRMRAINYLIMLEKSDELSDIIWRMQTRQSWNPQAKFVIFFTGMFSSDDEAQNNTEMVLNVLLNHDILDSKVMFIVGHHPNVLVVKTWFPFEGNNCGQKIKNIRLINTCEVMKPNELDPRATTNFTLSNSRQEVFVENDKIILVYHFFTNLYPKFPDKFHKCLLRVSTYMKEPFVLVKNDHIVGGLEVEMLKAISRKLDFIPIFQHMKNPAGNFSTDSIHSYYAELFAK